MPESLSYFQHGLWLVIVLSAPPLITATLFGVIVSLVQAVTQIQDQTLPYTIKLVTVAISVTAVGRWIGSELIELLNLALAMIPNVGR